MSDKRIMLVSSNTLDKADKCYRLLQYSTLEGNSPLEKPDYLEKGDMLHKVLENHYRMKKDGKPYLEIINASIELGRRYAIELELEPEEVENVIRTYIDYADFRRNERWEIVAVEEVFLIDFHEDDELIIKAQGKTDLLIKVENVDYIIPVDHKGQKKKTYHNNLNNQFALNALAWDARNLVVNNIGFQKTKTKEERFRRETIPYPKAWLEDWIQWTIFKLKQLDNYLQSGIYPPNFTSCWNCFYKEVCQSTPDNREYKLKTAFKQIERFELFNEDDEEEDKKE
jgi:hypothetical protein